MSEQPIPDRLSEYLLPLESTNPERDHDDLHKITRIFEDRRVIGLGEATHGTREYFRFKDRLIRFFIEKLGVRTVALEANFAEAFAINDYVLDAEGDPRDALANLHLWPWDTQEVLDLINWLRDFNQARPVEDQVRFYGIDAQYTAGAVAELRSFLKQVDPAYLNRIEDTLQRVDDDGQLPNQDESIESQFSAVDQLLDELSPRFQEREAAYIERTDEETVCHAERCLRTIERVRARKQALQADDIAGAMAIRDQAMADNVDWLLDSMDSDRLVIWAHNGHVNRLENRSNGNTAPSMGAHLAEMYGNAYYALGFEFGGGEFRAIRTTNANSDEGREYRLGEQELKNPLPGTLGRAFAAFDDPLFLIDIDSAKEDPELEDWLEGPSRLHSIGAVFQHDDVENHVERYPVEEAFDGLCFISNTTPTRPIERD